MALSPREREVHSRNLHRIEVVAKTDIDPFSQAGDALSRRLLATPAGHLTAEFVGCSVLAMTDLATGQPAPARSYSFQGERSLNRALFEAHRLVDAGIKPVVITFGLPAGRFRQAAARASAVASLPVSSTPPERPEPPPVAKALGVPDVEAPDAIERVQAVVDRSWDGPEVEEPEVEADEGDGEDVYATVIEVFAEAAALGRNGGRALGRLPEEEEEPEVGQEAARVLRSWAEAA